MTVFLGVVVGIIIFVIWGINDGKKEMQMVLDHRNVKHALWRLELAMDYSMKYASMEASVLTMYSRDNDKYEIILYTNTISNVEAHMIIKDDSCWDILKDEFGKTCLRYIGFKDESIRWKVFNKAVWTVAKNKHPEWKITYISEEKSAISF